MDEDAGQTPCLPRGGLLAARGHRAGAVFAVFALCALSLLGICCFFNRCAIAGNVSPRDRDRPLVACQPVAQRRRRRGQRWRPLAPLSVSASSCTSAHLASNRPPPPRAPRARPRPDPRASAPGHLQTNVANVNSASFLAHHPPPPRRRPFRRRACFTQLHHEGVGTLLLLASLRADVGACQRARPGAVTIVIAAGWSDVTAEARRGASAAAGPDSGGAHVTRLSRRRVLG